MTEPGWYDDPDGTPFRLRYWDGSQWTQQLAPAAPDQPTDPGVPGRTNNWLKPVLIAVLIFALLGGVYTLLVKTEVLPAPGVQVTGRRPAEFDSPTAAPSTTLVCPQYSGTRTAEVTDGDAARVYGGELSMTRPPNAQSNRVRLSFADSQEVVMFEVVEGWAAPAVVAGVLKADGFTDLATAAELVQSCLLNDPSLYSNVTKRTEVLSEALTVDGRPAHQVRSDVRVEVPGHPEVAGDITDVIVVDTGDPLGYSFFFGAWPIGDAELERELADLAASLRVER